MLTLIESIERKMCYWCEEDVAGKLQTREVAIFNRTGLCPECWIYSIKSNKKGSDKIPVQMGLPIVGSMPAIIQMSPVSFGTLCSTRSELLRDCMIRTIYRGPICTFDIICRDEVTRNDIRDYLIGEV